MIWLVVNEDGTELVFQDKPRRRTNWIKLFFSFIYSCNIQYWDSDPGGKGIVLPRGTIQKLIGKELTWSDEAVKIEKWES